MINMFGTAHWCGTFDGQPAIILSCYCNATLWVYEDGWKERLVWGCLAGIWKKLGLPDPSERGEAITSGGLEERHCLKPGETCGFYEGKCRFQYTGVKP